MILKQGVNFDFQEPMLAAFPKIERVMCKYGTVVMTCGREPRKGNSLHPFGLAADFRAKHLNASDQRIVLADLKAALGSDYDVLLHGEGENIHYHVEYDPDSERATFEHDNPRGA